MTDNWQINFFTLPLIMSKGITSIFVQTGGTIDELRDFFADKSMILNVF
jgi:hypothetical protein